MINSLTSDSNTKYPMLELTEGNRVIVPRYWIEYVPEEDGTAAGGMSDIVNKFFDLEEAIAYVIDEAQESGYAGYVIYDVFNGDYVVEEIK